MLTGYKTYIGIGIWAIGAVIVEFLGGTGIAAFGPPLMEFGKVIVAGGFVAKAARFMAANGTK